MCTVCTFYTTSVSRRHGKMVGWVVGLFKENMEENVLACRRSPPCDFFVDVMQTQCHRPNVTDCVGALRGETVPTYAAVAG